MPLRVLIVDDHPMFRMGLAAALAEMDGIELVGQAETADGWRRWWTPRNPTSSCSTSACRTGPAWRSTGLAERHPAVKVILLTMSEDHETVLTALRDGARGYLVKGTGPDRVEQALRSVMAGDVVLNHDVAQAVSELAHARTRSTRNRPSRP